MSKRNYSEDRREGFREAARYGLRLKKFSARPLFTLRELITEAKKLRDTAFTFNVKGDMEYYRGCIEAYIAIIRILEKSNAKNTV